ncbi:hypothetical protein Tco_0595727 [Tanacetum coccineum]
MESIKQCIVERAHHEQELQNRLKRLSERKLQIQECKIQEVKALDVSLGDKDSSGIASDKGNDQGLENQGNTSGDKSSKSRNECNDKSTSGDDSEDYQEYGLPIPDVMLNDAIKRLESYQIFIKYSTNQIPPKKSRGKGSKGKKTVDESQETVNVSEESELESEPAKKKTSSKRRVKKKVTLSADDNIIFDDLDAALELAKSISQTEAEEAEAARKVHATHARIVTEVFPESAKKKSSGRSSKSVVIQDTPSTPKSKPATSKTKLKGAPSLTPQEQEAANIMQALKERVPDESTFVSATSSEGTGAKPRVPDEDKDTTKDKVILELGDEQDIEFSDDDNDDVEKDDKDGDVDDEGDDHVSDTQDADDEDVKTESDEDEIYNYKICVRNEEDVKMKDAEVEESNKGKEKITDVAKEEAKKTSEAKDDTKKYELP